ncbi:MAG TPA: hypothetical protein VFK89_10905, partial [Actinomycetota bacterium]|nr:hypothetical protein [Actinomycetota bacterium]
LDEPHHPAIADVEDAGIARMELSRVQRALTRLTPAQRHALMHDHVSLSPSEKMLRLRARKKLRSLVERVPALVWWRARKTDPATVALVYKDGVAQTIACVACALFGAAAIPLTLTPGAPDARPSLRMGSTVTSVSPVDHGLRSMDDGWWPHPGARAGRSSHVASAVTGASRSAQTSNDDGTVQLPATTAPLPVSGDPTSLPGNGDGDSPLGPPPVDAGIEPATVTEVVETVTGATVDAPGSVGI